MDPAAARQAVSVTEAARQLGVVPSTIRRMIQRGAPCHRPGEVGRGHGARVVVDELRRWRAPDVAALDQQAILNLTATALWDTLRRDEAHLRAGIDESQAAAVLVLVYQRLWLNLARRPLEELRELPDQMKRLCAICVA